MIDLYYWPTPNGWKITIFLEECEIPYNIVPVNIGTGEQFEPDFLKLSPNNRMPAIVDHDVDGPPITIFESGAILLYLAEKTGRFIPNDIRGRVDVLQWLFWQMGNLGPMMGQANHFLRYAPQITDQDLSYPAERYTNETHRLIKVMNTRLEDRDYLAGEYSIADMASWPWAILLDKHEFDFSDFPHVRKWLDTLAERPALQRGYKAGNDLSDRSGKLSEEAKKTLFGQK